MASQLLASKLLDSHPVFHDSAELHSHMLHLSPFTQPSKYIFGPNGTPIPYTDKLNLKDHGREHLISKPFNDVCQIWRVNWALNGMRRAVESADKLTSILEKDHYTTVSPLVVPKLRLDVVDIHPLGHFGSKSEITLAKLLHAQLALNHANNVVESIKGDVEFFHWPAKVQTAILRPFLTLKLYATNLLDALTKCHAPPVDVPAVFRLSKTELLKKAGNEQSSLCDPTGTRVLVGGFL
jgi:hypothetical protein